MRRRDDLAYAGGLVFGALILVLAGFVELRETRYAAQNDWSGIWAGARAIVDGVDPYDPARWQAYATSVQAQGPETTVYGYPAWIALALVPFALLPLEVAAALWTYGGLVAAALAMRALLRARLPGLPAAHTLVGLALVASQPAIVAYLDGQWSFALVALAAVAFVARSGVTSGLVAAAALLAKPQLFLLFVPAFARAAIRRGRPRAAVALALAVGAAAVVSLAVFPGWPGAYLSGVIAPRLPAESRATTLATALHDLVGPTGPALAVLGLCAGVVAALRHDPGSDAALAVWLAVSIAAAPYTWSYDQLVLLVPIVVGAGALAADRPGRALVLVAAGTCALLLLGTVLHGVFADARASESYNALTAVTICALVTVLLRPVPRPRT